MNEKMLFIVVCVAAIILFTGTRTKMEGKRKIASTFPK